MLGVGFYEDVLVELLAALGAALFLGNLLALVRRRQDQAAGNVRPARPTRARTALEAPEAPADAGPDTDLAQAPVARTVAYMALGLVVMVWGLASMFG